MNTKDAIELAKAGSEKAFTFLYNTHNRAIYRVIYNVVKNKDVADDLLSETFLKAFKNIDKFTKDISFEMWLKTIANHHSIDFVRSGQKNQRDVYIDDDMLSEFIYTDYTNPEKDLIKKEEYERFEDGFKSLGKRSKEVLNYRLKDGLSYQEIADKMGLSIGTIKHYIFKYKSKLIKAINNQ